MALWCGMRTVVAKPLGPGASSSSMVSISRDVVTSTQGASSGLAATMA